MSDLLIHVSRQAMACEFELRFPAENEQGTELALEALDLVESLEAKLSYFRATSQISRINLLAAEQPVEVEPGLFDLLSAAKRLSQETEGAYDITAAPLWEVWGFARRAGEIPSDAQLADARARVGSQNVELDAQGRTVRFLKPGVRVNLGSIGKGYALDLCAEQLTGRGMADFLLHGGQSSVLARGLQNPSGSKQPWEIGVLNPHQPGRRLGAIRLRNRALGTSGAQFQSFRHRGRRYGHILDPRSGMPAEGVLSSTVVAPTAAMADALSTAFYVMGPERSMQYCQQHPDIGAVLLCPAPQGQEIVVHHEGISTDDLEGLS